MHEADWDLFQQKLNSQINVTNLDDKTLEEIENALVTWTKVVKNAMDAAIPKSNHQYVYQLKTTPEIRALKIQYKTLTEFATHFGWTTQTYREFHRIKTEMREKCKEACNKNWENKINFISVNSKNSKEFWRKI